MRRLDPGRPSGGARPVALEARGRADQQVASGRVAVIGERVDYVARGEGGLAGGLGQLRVLGLEEQLASEYVKGLVEVMRVQRGPALRGGRTISVTDTWPPVSSLRIRTLRMPWL